ncbi:AraC family transcriptional regulator, partial [Mesorhizobium sp. M8A.F.Ca.ET.059.01.1.1]
MNPTEKALWFVESHLPEAVTLDDVAHSSGVSRFHVTRAFGAATGRSVMGYMRSRR